MMRRTQLYLDRDLDVAIGRRAAQERVARAIEILDSPSTAFPNGATVSGNLVRAGA
jgi:hypothetical protein